MNSERHPADNNKRQSKERGNKAELLLRLSIEAAGQVVKTATALQDKRNHIDLFIVRPNKEVPIQVKAIPSSYSDYLCVEIKGTKYDGSLYASKAEYLAFEQEDYFIFVPMEEIRKYVILNISTGLSTDKKYAIENKCKYQRQSTYGTNHLAFVHLDELIKMAGMRKLKKVDLKSLGFNLEDSIILF